MAANTHTETTCIVPYPVDKKLVIAISSGVLFDLSEADAVYRSEGTSAYQAYQESRLDQTLAPGMAFSFIRGFLELNARFPEQMPVDVVLLSRNSTATGRRVFRSIQDHGLGITRAAFLNGASPFPYIPAYNASLFLTGNEADVHAAIAAGHPAGLVIPSLAQDDRGDEELRIGYDFDGVIANDEAEAVYQAGGLTEFEAHETLHAMRPHSPGMLGDLFQKIGGLQRLERAAKAADPQYKPMLKTAIVTARMAPAHDRLVNTLLSWQVEVDHVFLLGGLAKSPVLGAFQPHIFIDDQLRHLKAINLPTALVHIPAGAANRS